MMIHMKFKRKTPCGGEPQGGKTTSQTRQGTSPRLPYLTILASGEKCQEPNGKKSNFVIIPDDSDRRADTRPERIRRSLLPRHAGRL